jgi:hypothetical protein
MKNISSIVSEMIELLETYGYFDWAKALKLNVSYMIDSPTEAKSRIISMYGGMGSLNDIVLHQNSVPNLKDNLRFSELRSELYNICIK